MSEFEIRVREVVWDGEVEGVQPVRQIGKEIEVGAPAREKEATPSGVERTINRKVCRDQPDAATHANLIFAALTRMNHDRTGKAITQARWQNTWPHIDGRNRVRTDRAEQTAQMVGIVQRNAIELDEVLLARSAAHVKRRRIVRDRADRGQRLQCAECIGFGYAGNRLQVSPGHAHRCRSRIRCWRVGHDSYCSSRFHARQGEWYYGKVKVEADS